MEENTNADDKGPEVDKNEGAAQKLQEELDKEKKRADEYYKRLQYLQADFENYRKRIEKERMEDAKIGELRLIVKILGLLDEFELALEAMKKSDDKQQVLKGLEALYGKFINLLNKEGVQSIPALGMDFDPSIHEVVGSVPVETSMVGKVVEEVRKGFMFEGKVLRPSAVKIGVKEVDTV
ncbi:MAG: nucleotide exchange factor GrpE [Conexivisphaerales archaeon]